MALWINRNGKPLIKGHLSHTFCGKGFFAFLFEMKEDMDLVFKSGPYFMGSRGLYLNRWTSEFYLENGIPTVMLVWVRLPFLSLHFWNDETI
jgi:hypothetical protein